MSDPPTSDSKTLRLARQGDPEAVGRLLGGYRNYLNMLARIWLHRTFTPMVDQSDMVQDTLLKAHEHLADFRGSTEAELTAWLRRILARTIGNAVRRFGATARQLSRERSLEQILQDSSRGVNGLLAASGSSPSRAAQRRELGVVLADALAEMDPDHREVIVLRSLQGCDWTRVAEKMDRSPDAARMLWTRALKQLRPHIDSAL